jgi:peptidyl-prolyl cis-trans isomerase A (cyclophilin A)
MTDRMRHTVGPGSGQGRAFDGVLCRAATGAVVLFLAAACRHVTPSRPSPLLSAPAEAERAPAVFRVRFETTRGPFIVEARRAWAPAGVDRFYQLARLGYYDGTRFFRVVDGFMVQWGISGDTAVARAWGDRRIADDPVTQSNRRATVTFATSGPNTRTTQLFVNYRDNTFLDAQGFAPLGEVVEGMDVVDNLWRSYGDAPPGGRGPDQARIVRDGELYLAREFPRLDKVLRAHVEPVSVR